MWGVRQACGDLPFGKFPPFWEESQSIFESNFHVPPVGLELLTALGRKLTLADASFFQSLVGCSGPVSVARPAGTGLNSENPLRLESEQVRNHTISP